MTKKQTKKATPKTKTVEKQIFTFAELAKEYNRDPSHIAKMVKENKIKTTPVIDKKHACQALSLKEKAKLENKNPQLKLPLLSNKDKELTLVAKERKQDTSGLLKFLKTHEYKLEKRQRPDGGRPVNVMSEATYKKLMKEHPIRIKL